jgi:hypothetical protein
VSRYGCPQSPPELVVFGGTRSVRHADGTVTCACAPRIRGATLGVVFSLHRAENGIEYTRPDAEASACVEARTAPEHAHAAAQMMPTEARMRTFLPRLQLPPFAGAHRRERVS